MNVAVLLSGGLDSSTLLAHVVRRFADVHALSFAYEQRHARERTAAARVAAHFKVPLTTIGIDPTVFAGGSVLTGEGTVPEGHYEAESMRQTVVPNRNMVLLALAAAWTQTHRGSMVAYAAHTGDHAIYADCRPEFIESCAETIARGTDHTVELYAPFQRRLKADIVRMGALLGVPFELTYSCYVGGPKHCGKCGTCVERREAFQLAGVDDPTEYEAL